jgi:hypothetical protein
MLIVGILDFASFQTIYTPSQHHLNKLEKSLFQSFVPQWCTVVVGQNFIITKRQLAVQHTSAAK